MAEPLSACPFCGSPAELERESDHHGGWFNLGCSRHWGRVGRDAACPGGRIWYTADPSEEAGAIEAWNRRALPQLAERERVLVEALTQIRLYARCNPEGNYPGILRVVDEALATLQPAGGE